MSVPDPAASESFTFADYEVTELSGLSQIKAIEWKDLDFTGARLGKLRFMDATVRNCVFNQAFCQGWRIWSTKIGNSSFARADLRGSQMGALFEGRASEYHQVDFTKADLRDSHFPSTELYGCTFIQGKLKKLRFNGCSLSDCVFEGTLPEVSFYREGLNVGAPNTISREMVNVDFSRAKFRWVEIRGYDLNQVKLPADDDHLIVEDVKNSLGRIIKALNERPDKGSHGMAAALECVLNWTGTNQCRGVISKHDLLESVGEDHFDEVVDLIRSSITKVS